MTREILIDPLTRLEGHGRINVFLDADGEVERAYLQIPELRGFEKFAQGRRAEDMPQITSRICGVCPMAHHMAATKALDDLYQVAPASGRQEDPRAPLQRVHGRGPRAALLLPRRTRLHRRPGRAETGATSSASSPPSGSRSERK